MLKITEIKEGYLVPLLEEKCEAVNGYPLDVHLFQTVLDGLELLYLVAGLDPNEVQRDEMYFDLHAIAADPDIAALLCCYERDNARLASSFHASELKPRSCLRRLSYPLVGFKSKKEFSAYATLTALVGDWVHQALQELMEQINGLLARYLLQDENGKYKKEFESGLELDLKRAKLATQYLRDELRVTNIGCRIDMQLVDPEDVFAEVTGDIKTNNSSKWSDARKHFYDLEKYGYQVIIGGHFTNADWGLILEVCRDTFALREHRVEFDNAAQSFLGSTLTKVTIANQKVQAFNETFKPNTPEWKQALADPELLPEPNPGKGYESCWGCPWNYKMICPASDWEKNQ